MTKCHLENLTSNLCPLILYLCVGLLSLQYLHSAMTMHLQLSLRESIITEHRQRLSLIIPTFFYFFSDA